MKITLVKKLLADGSPCRKCVEVMHKLDTSGYAAHIDRVVAADEHDPTSEGMQIARQYKVNRAPFFLVEELHKPPRVYTVYLQFVKEVLEPRNCGKKEKESSSASE